MKWLMYIAFAAAVLSGCRNADGLRRAEPTHLNAPAVSPAKRPEWFQGRFRTGTPGADKFVAHWDGVFRKGSIDDKAFLDANAILDAALLESLGNAEACAVLQHDHIVNDCMYLLFKSHEAINDTEGDIMESTLNGRRLAAVLKANEKRFSEWLPEFRKWDKAHNDWSGVEWSSLFEKRKPLSRLKAPWLGRKATADEKLYMENIEQWRAAETFPVELGKEVERHFGQGEKRLWLLQAIDKPEVPEGVKVYMNIHAFPGRCKVYVNAMEAISFDDMAPRSFSVPLDFKDGKQCVVIVELMALQPPGGDAVQHAPWPAWLVCDKR